MEQEIHLVHFEEQNSMLKQANQTTPMVRSPIDMVEERLSDDPWSLVVLCVLLEQTTRPKALAAHQTVMEACPDAGALVRVGQEKLARELKPAGLSNLKARRLLAAAALWPKLVKVFGVRPPAEALVGLSGWSERAEDRYRIFVERVLRPDAPHQGDPWLEAYCRWARTGSVNPGAEPLTRRERRARDAKAGVVGGKRRATSDELAQWIEEAKRIGSK